METGYLQDRLRQALNRELIKRLLTRYFSQKGFEENFDRRVHPPLLQDLPFQIPQLYGKIEIQPYVEDIDPNTGIVRLGWNLFVLGTQRISLGYSTHTNLNEVRTAIAGPLAALDRGSHATPRRIINFITEVLSRSKHGDITCVPKTVTSRVSNVLPLGTGEMSGFFRTNRPVF